MTAEIFKWRILVLDDESATLGDLGDFLSTVGSCDILGQTIGDLPKYLSEEAPYHLVLIDMDWRLRVASRIVEQLPTPAAYDLKSEDGKSQFTEEWLMGLRTAYDRRVEWLTPSLETGENKGSLRNTQVGLWMGALVSHLFPSAIICFYTYHDKVPNEAHIAPWLHYRNFPIEILTKDPRERTSANQRTLLQVGQLTTYLTRCQSEFIAKSPDLQKWAEQVWLRLFLAPDEKLLEAVNGKILSVPGAREPRTYAIQSEAFFPQISLLKGNRRALLDGIAQAVFQRNLRTSVSKSNVSRAFHAIKNFLNALAPERREELKDTVFYDLWRLGEAGRAALRSFQGGHYCSTLKCLYALVDGRSYINRKCRIEKNPLPTSENPSLWEALSTLDSGNQSSSSGGLLNVLNKQLVFPSPVSPFCLVAELWDDIVTNIEGDAVGSWYWRNSSRSDRREVRIEFRQQPGFIKTLGEFRTRVCDSLEQKGPDRGLPRVAVAAFELGATSLEILIEKNWWDIASEEQIPDVDDDNSRYGIRLTFPSEV